jgi:hypothetical protein
MKNISDLMKLGVVREISRRKLPANIHKGIEEKLIQKVKDRDIGYNTAHKLFSEAEVDLGKGLDLGKLAGLIGGSTLGQSAKSSYGISTSWLNKPWLEDVKDLAKALIKEINNCFKDS